MKFASCTYNKKGISMRYLFYYYEKIELCFTHWLDRNV